MHILCRAESHSWDASETNRGIVWWNHSHCLEWPQSAAAAAAQELERVKLELEGEQR